METLNIVCIFVIALPFSSDDMVGLISTQVIAGEETLEHHILLKGYWSSIISFNVLLFPTRKPLKTSYTVF